MVAVKVPDEQYLLRLMTNMLPRKQNNNLSPGYDTDRRWPLIESQVRFLFMPLHNTHTHLQMLVIRSKKRCFTGSKKEY